MRVPTIPGALLPVVASAILAVLAKPAPSAETFCPREPVHGTHDAQTGIRVVKLPVNLQKVKALQRSFDEGHQPWRADPKTVAAVEIVSRLKMELDVSPQILEGRLVVESEKEREALVVGKRTRCWYRVHLKRLVKADNGSWGIWTPTRIEYREGKD